MTKPAVEEPIVETPTVETPTVETVVTQAPKKKVVRKVTKNVVNAPEEENKEEPIPQTKVEEVANLDVSEVKVKPQAKRIVKKVYTNNSETTLVKETKEEPTKKSKKTLEILEFDAGKDANSMDGCDELEANIYVDTQIYNDEDSDSLEPREVNGVKYYIDSSNYVYHIETQDLIGKLNEKGDNILFLSDFSS